MWLVSGRVNSGPTYNKIRVLNCVCMSMSVSVHAASQLAEVSFLQKGLRRRCKWCRIWKIIELMWPVDTLPPLWKFCCLLDSPSPLFLISLDDRTSHPCSGPGTEEVLIRWELNELIRWLDEWQFLNFIQLKKGTVNSYTTEIDAQFITSLIS